LRHFQLSDTHWGGCCSDRTPLSCLGGDPHIGCPDCWCLWLGFPWPVKLNSGTVPRLNYASSWILAFYIVWFRHQQHCKIATTQIISDNLCVLLLFNTANFWLLTMTEWQAIAFELPGM
jgi:hypothetical protein